MKKIDQKDTDKREIICCAVGKLLQDDARTLVHDELSWSYIEALADRMPGLSLHEAIESFTRLFKPASLKREKPAADPAPAPAKKPRAPREKHATPAPSPAATLAAAVVIEDLALDLVSAQGATTVGALLKAAPDATRGQATGALARLVARGRLVQSGKGRGTVYKLANGTTNGATKQLALDEAAAS